MTDEALSCVTVTTALHPPAKQVRLAAEDQLRWSGLDWTIPRLRAGQLPRLSEDKVFAIDGTIRDLGYAPRPFADGISGEGRLLGSTG